MYVVTASVLCRGHPDIERPVLSFWEEANLVQADKEEAHLVREFKERLRYNLQQVHHTTPHHTVIATMSFALDMAPVACNIFAVVVHGCDALL